MKENEILKKTLRHYIDLEYYANGVDEEFQSKLEELKKKCRFAIEDKEVLNTKTQYGIVMRYIKELVDEFQKDLESRLEEEAEIIMQEEESFLDSVYNDKKSDVSKAALVIGGVTASKILFAPFDGKDTTQQFVERTKNNIIHAYETPLRSGYLFGQKSADVANTAELNMRKVASGMQNGIRTAIPAYAKTTDRIIFLNNNSEVIYCATLDGRTCIVCGNFHNMRFKSITEAPALAIHENCRCCYLKASEVTEPLPSYKEYFESLSEEEQKHILGASRFKIWKDYNFPLKGFTNNGTKIKLGELNPRLSDKVKQDREMSNGYRRSVYIPMTKEEKDLVLKEAKAIGIPTDKLVFLENHGTGYSDDFDLVVVGSNVFPSNDRSTHNRDNMTIRAVLAHEYYGHGAYRNTKLPKGSWNDEFRASYHAAIHTPNLSDMERQSLMRDAVDRAVEAGVQLRMNDVMRRILYGYEK